MIARGRWRDPRGDTAQIALVAATLFMLPLGTVPLTIVSAIAIVYMLLRLWVTLPAIGYLIFRVPVVWALLALMAWTLLSLMWSPDRPQGWDEAAIFRFQVPFLIALWPVADRWRIGVWALACGAAVASLVQIGQWALPDDWPMYFWWHNERIPGRYPGLIHPNSTAIVAVAAIWLLWLARPFTARGRAAAVVLAAMAITGLVLTGSRGGWLAALAGAAAATPSMLRAWRSASWRVRGAVLAALIPVAVIAALLAPQVAGRARSAFNDLQAAIEQRDYSGDVAARWRQNEITLHMLRRHPLTGVGAGGYLVQARRYVQSPAASRAPAGGTPDPARPQSTGLLIHPHSTLLYHTAVLGVSGLLLYLSLWTALGWMVFRRPPRGAPLAWAPILAALFVAFALDCHNLSAPGTLVLMFVIAIATYESRAEARWRPPGDTGPPPPNNDDPGSAHA